MKKILKISKPIATPLVLITDHLNVRRLAKVRLRLVISKDAAVTSAVSCFPTPSGHISVERGWVP
jgi:hypothetical protein